MPEKPPIYLVCQGALSSTVQRMEPPPLGILYVGQALKDAGYPVRLFHLRGERDSSLQEAVAAAPPLFVGFSNFISPLLVHDLRLSRWVHDQGVKVVWGGIFSTSLPEVPLGSGYVDYIVAGEGEKSAVALAQALEDRAAPAGIPGVGYREDDRIVLTPPAPPEIELDKFRFGWDLFDWREYVLPMADGHRFLSIPFSRGCPFRCSFCYNALNPTRQRWRVHSREYLREMTAFFQKRYGANLFFFECDNPFGKVAEAQRIIEALNVSWMSAAHLSVATPEFLDWARANHCLKLGFGVESGSDRTLARMNKRITREEIREKILRCGEKGLYCNTTWMTFVPGETREDLQQTFSLMDELWEKNPRHYLSHNVFRAYPATTFWEECLALGHRAPTTLEEWATYQGEIYPLLGFHPRQVQRLLTLVHVLYNQDKTKNRAVPPALRPFLVSRLKRARFFGPVEEILRFGRATRDRLRTPARPQPPAS